MKTLVCEICGSNNLIKDGDFFVCQACGTKYTVEAAKKMMVEGTVEVQGTVKVDKSNELDTLYQLARRAKSANDSANGAKYYESILLLNPSDWEASFYSVYYQSLNCKIANIQSSAINLSNNLDNVLQLVKNKENDFQEKKAIIEEISSSLIHISSVFISNAIQYKEYIAGLSAVMLFYDYCNSLIVHFEEDSVKDIIHIFWKKFIENAHSLYEEVRSNSVGVIYSDGRDTSNMNAKQCLKNFSTTFKCGKYFYGVITDICYISLDCLGVSLNGYFIPYNLINNIVLKEKSRNYSNDNFRKYITYHILINGDEIAFYSKDDSYGVNTACLELRDRVKAINSNVVYEENLLPKTPDAIYITDSNLKTHEIIFYNDCLSIDEEKASYSSITHAQLVPYGYSDKEFAVAVENVWWKVFKVSGYHDEEISQLENVVAKLKQKAHRINAVSNENSNTSSTSSGGCYVATCVYGSYDCPEVWTLRRYRDNTLGSTWYGRAFIKLYYAISPTLVKWFGHTKWFKKMWKGKLDKMVKELQDSGVENTPYQDKKW